jgi:hypothetical protein
MRDWCADSWDDMVRVPVHHASAFAVQRGLQEEVKERADICSQITDEVRDDVCPRFECSVTPGVQLQFCRLYPQSAALQGTEQGLLRKSSPYSVICQITTPPENALLAGNASQSVLRSHLVVSFGAGVGLGRRAAAGLHAGPAAWV